MADPRIDQARHERNVEKAKRRNAEEELKHSEALFDVIQKTNGELTAEADLYKYQRDQLLEGIEAHRSESTHGSTANMEYADKTLHALADRIKSKGGGDASAPRTTGRDRTASILATRGGSEQVDGVAPEQTSCPTCGQPVEVHHGEEGTSYYLPVSEDRKLRELLEWAETTADSYSLAPPGEINEWSGRIYRDLARRISASLSSEASS